MCDCVKNIEQEFKAKYHAYDCRLEHFGGGMSIVDITPYRKDGEIAKHNRYASVDWQFCPFCGKEIEKQGAKR